MKPADLMVGVLTGGLLIVFGLVPGLFYGLVEGIRNFNNSLSSSYWARAPQESGSANRQGPFWLAGLGGGLILLTLAGYLTS
jgi:hypothetical protein